MIHIASKLAAVKPSASAWVSVAAQEARKAGKDVIDLGLGEPDFDTPPHIVEAAHQAAVAGETRYPPTQGTVALRQAIKEKFARENGLDYGIESIIVSNGAKQIIFNALMASIEEGDEILLCAPYFGSYKDIVLVLGGVPKIIECPAEDQFRLSRERLESAITERTRWVFLNLPSNPSGAFESVDGLRAIGEVLARHPHVAILSDEIYEHILFDGREFSSFVTVCPELKDRVLTVNGVSKSYAMTGWRIGYAGGPAPLISAMTKVQSQVSSGACSVAQAAAVAALQGPQDNVTAFRVAFERRRNLVVEKVAHIDGLTLDAPAGAFYAFIGCDAFIGSTRPDGSVIDDDAAFAGYLLDDAGVATVPGSAYELEPFFRISTAAPDAVLDDALDRIAASVAKLAPRAAAD